jgi:D-alanyl-D-alanine carboxypeptidase
MFHNRKPYTTGRMRAQRVPETVLATFLVSLFSSIACSGRSPVDPAPTLEQELEQVLEASLRVHEVKGVSAAVVLSDDRLWLGTEGDSHQGVPITPEMRFSIYSTTKVFTAALILQLVDEDRVSLEDSLGEWLPAYDHIDPRITVRQLLNHTSGVFDMNEHPAIRAAMLEDLSRVVTPEEIVTRFVLEPYFAPGEDWHYSNTNYLLLGMIAKQATGSDISVELRKRFWEPLALGSTYFAVEEEIAGPIAHGWSNRGTDGPLRDISSEPINSVYSGSWTSGAVVSTAADIARWSDGLYGGRVLSAASLAEMLKFYRPTSGLEPVVDGYGLGTHRYGAEIVNGETVFGHAGGFDGYTSAMAYLPEYDVSIAILVNQESAVEFVIEVLNGFVALISADARGLQG